MGEIADYYIEQYYADPSTYRHAKSSHSKSPSGTTWTSVNGKVHKIRDMESTHILNCLHLVERREGNKGVKFLNEAPTYKSMVIELFNRKVLRKDYFRLSLLERQATWITE